MSLPRSCRWLLSWGREVLAPETSERTLGAAEADLRHEIASSADATRRSESRGRRAGCSCGCSLVHSPKTGRKRVAG